MKTDTYTKTMLTIIAAALMVIAFNQFPFANNSEAHSKSFNTYNTLPVNSDGSVNVKIMSDMDVNIKSLGGSSIYGALPVNVKEMNLNSVSGTLPVNIKSLNGSGLYNYLPVKNVN
jgi:hypothetical protein